MYNNTYMESSTSLADLQKAANYRMVRNTLRSGGIGSIVFGALALVIVLTGTRSNVFSARLATLGAILLITGIWTVVAPNPKSIIVDGVSIILIGAWNICIAHTSHISGGFMLLGAIQIVWGVRRFRRYRLLSSLEMLRPSSLLMRWMDNLVLKLYGARPSEFRDVIAFQRQDGIKMIWKSLVSDDIAVLIEGIGDRLVFAGKTDISITRLDNATSGDLAKVLIKVLDGEIPAVMPIPHLDRFEIWHKSLNENDWAGFNGLKLAESINWEQMKEGLAVS